MTRAVARRARGASTGNSHGASFSHTLWHQATNTALLGRSVQSSLSQRRPHRTPVPRVPQKGVLAHSSGPSWGAWCAPLRLALWGRRVARWRERHAGGGLQDDEALPARQARRHCGAVCGVRGALPRRHARLPRPPHCRTPGASWAVAIAPPARCVSSHYPSHYPAYGVARTLHTPHGRGTHGAFPGSNVVSVLSGAPRVAVGGGVLASHSQRCAMLTGGAWLRCAEAAGRDVVHRARAHDAHE